MLAQIFGDQALGKGVPPAPCGVGRRPSRLRQRRHQRPHRGQLQGLQHRLRRPAHRPTDAFRRQGRAGASEFRFVRRSQRDEPVQSVFPRPKASDEEQVRPHQGGPPQDMRLARPLFAHVQGIDARARIHLRGGRLTEGIHQQVAIPRQLIRLRRQHLTRRFLEQVHGFLGILDPHRALGQGITDDGGSFFLRFLAEALQVLPTETHRKSQAAGLRGHHREALDRVVAVFVERPEIRRRGGGRPALDHGAVRPFQAGAQPDGQHGFQPGNQQLAQAGQFVGAFLQRRQHHHQNPPL